MTDATGSRVAIFRLLGDARDGSLIRVVGHIPMPPDLSDEYVVQTESGQRWNAYASELHDV